MGKLITSRQHGILDYVGGVVLILAPWIFGFSDVDAARNVPIILGIIILLQSLITDYELSLADILPLRMHLALDMLGGAVLAASPWLFGFADEDANAWLPHLIVGIALIGAALMTQPYRETERSGDARETRRTSAL